MTTQPPAEVLERVLSRVAMGSNGCHISAGRVGRGGYAVVEWCQDGKQHYVRLARAVWTAARGPIPAGLTVDHTCRTPRCIRLDHLRLLTHSENVRRNWGHDFPLGQSCPADHPLERRQLRGGALICLDCKNARNRAYAARNRERVAETNRRWREANAEQHREAVRRYRAKRKTP